MKHTETPWAIRDLEIIGPYKSNKSICEMTRAFMNEDEQKENIRHIVHCVNTHDELVKALKDIADSYDMLNSSTLRNGLKNHTAITLAAIAKKALKKVTDTTPINQ